MTSRFVALVCSLLALADVMIGCSGQRVVALMPGVVNDPRNRTLRRQILRAGSREFCQELTQRGTPVRLQEDAPVVGRFYAHQCDLRDVDGGDAFLQFSGDGYAWTAPTARIGFQAGGAIQYNQDFLLNGSTMYAYFRPRSVRSTEFRAGMVERVQTSHDAHVDLVANAETLGALIAAFPRQV